MRKTRIISILFHGAVMLSEEIGRQFRERQIPADGLWLDIQHMNGFRTFTWDPVAFPDPEGMIAGLSDQGFKTIIIADPGLKVDAEWDVYLDGLAGDHVLKTPDGAPFECAVWPGPAVFPDFTRPAARDRWGSLVRAAVEVGAAGIWLDVNEPSCFTLDPGGTISNDVVADGEGIAATMAEVHNVYALSEARATYEGMRLADPGRRPFILSRAGSAGIQRYAALWTGDAPSSWVSLGQTLPMLLDMGLSGLPFVGSDVGGFSGYATPELFARWMAVGSISPFFRGHVTTGVNNQEPWEFGVEVEDISRCLITERYRLLPYLYSLMAESAASGAPLLRPMVYAFQDDFEMIFDYDTAMPDPRPDVLVSFEVALPPGTPTDTPISIATSASGWSQIPLEWGPEPDTARGLVPLPRGEWFYYKYTRGDWTTVEKWEGCLEANNRYGFGAAYPVRQDVVATWADWCP